MRASVRTADRRAGTGGGDRHAGGTVARNRSFFVSPGWATEEIVLFRATLLSGSGQGCDHDEILNVVELASQRIPGLKRDRTLVDATTIIGLYRAFPHLL